MENLETRPFVIYHSVDPDGYASAYVLKQHYNEVILLPYNYETNYNFLNRIPNESKVYMVDTSLPNEILKQLNRRVDLTWIDHHDTAIQESLLDEEVKNIKGIRRNGTAACELTWEYINPNVMMPYALKLIGRYDVYDQKYFPEAIIFNYYLQTKNIKISPLTFDLWRELFSYNKETIALIVENNKILFDYVTLQNKIVAKSICYEANIFNYKCIVANRSRIGSDFFKTVATEDHDIMVAWHVNKKGLIKYTFYSNKENVHVGNIAKELAAYFNKKYPNNKFNFGGHLGAAGGVCNKILLPDGNLVEEELNNNIKIRKYNSETNQWEEINAPIRVS